jgi:hypothetical protein
MRGGVGGRGLLAFFGFRRMWMPVWAIALSRLAAVLAVSAGAFVIVGVWTLIPPGENPFAPLKLDDAMGPATPLKLARTVSRPRACSRLLLEAASLQSRPLEDQGECDIGGLENAVWIEQSATPYSAPVEASCPLAATLYLWEREVLQPLAEEQLGQPVARIEHYGTYSCRRINGGPTGDPSQHAAANAIDVAGFRLADGEVILLKEDWADEGPQGRFLRELHKRSCRLFHGVLGPEYNDLHHDHFHLDMGPYKLCR